MNEIAYRDPRRGRTSIDLLALLCLCILAGGVQAQAPTARQIVEEAQRQSRADSHRYEGTLQVISEKGLVAEKRWHYERLGSHGSSRAVLRFVAPAEVKGVALLIVNHPDRASDQWMWTPALQRERRITLQDRATRFFGTDFTFEDLEERDIDQSDYRLLGEEAVDGVTCWRIEARPRKTRRSQYTANLLYIRKDNSVFIQFEGFIEDELVRRVRRKQLELVTKIWSARLIEVTDFRRRSRTILRMEKLEYNMPMKGEDFTLPALRREL